MQEQVGVVLEEIFEYSGVAKIQDKTVKITVPIIKGNQLYSLSDLYMSEGVKGVELKRSGTSITVLVTVE